MPHTAPLLSPNLRWVQIENAIFILDLHRGDYSALGPEHLDAWLTLAGEPPTHPVPQDAVASLQAVLEQRGWLAPASTSAPISAHKKLAPATHFRTAIAIFLLARCMLCLRFRGFEKTYRHAMATAEKTTPSTNTKAHSVATNATAPTAKPPRQPRSAFHALPEQDTLAAETTADTHDLARALQTFQRAESLFFSSKGLEDCLPRSLALFLYLRRCGLPATHHIGVRRFPFGAHAWVDSNGTQLQRTITHGDVQRNAPNAATGLTDIAIIA